MVDVPDSMNTIELATELTVAWLNNPNNRASADEVPNFLQKMHETLNRMSDQGEPEAPQSAVQEYQPAVSPRKSLASKDYIISLIDGKPYKTLRRHLSRHGLTPDQYRERYNLKPDYPMVAENYSESRRSMAKQIGLGRKSTKTPADGPALEDGGAETKSAPRRRKSTKPGE